MTENEVILEIRNMQRFNYTLADNEVFTMAIQALEEIQAYRAIGTVEELKELKEKSEPKKTVGLYGNICPSCSWVVSHNNKYCESCGQHLDW